MLMGQIVYTRSGEAFEYRGMTPGGMVRLWGLPPYGGSMTEKPERVYETREAATQAREA